MTTSARLLKMLRAATIHRTEVGPERFPGLLNSEAEKLFGVSMSVIRFRAARVGAEMFG